MAGRRDERPSGPKRYSVAKVSAGAAHGPARQTGAGPTIWRQHPSIILSRSLAPADSGTQTGRQQQAPTAIWCHCGARGSRRAKTLKNLQIQLLAKANRTLIRLLLLLLEIWHLAAIGAHTQMEQSIRPPTPTIPATTTNTNNDNADAPGCPVLVLGAGGAPFLLVRSTISGHIIIYHHQLALICFRVDQI